MMANIHKRAILLPHSALTFDHQKFQQKNNACAVETSLARKTTLTSPKVWTAGTS